MKRDQSLYFSYLKLNSQDYQEIYTTDDTSQQQIIQCLESQQETNVSENIKQKDKSVLNSNNISNDIIYPTNFSLSQKNRQKNSLQTQPKSVDKNYLKYNDINLSQNNDKIEEIQFQNFFSLTAKNETNNQKEHENIKIIKNNNNDDDEIDNQQPYFSAKEKDIKQKAQIHINNSNNENNQRLKKILERYQVKPNLKLLKRKKDYFNALNIYDQNQSFKQKNEKVQNLKQKGFQKRHSMFLDLQQNQYIQKNNSVSDDSLNQNLQESIIYQKQTPSIIQFLQNASMNRIKSEPSSPLKNRFFNKQAYHLQQQTVQTEQQIDLKKYKGNKFDYIQNNIINLKTNDSQENQNIQQKQKTSLKQMFMHYSHSQNQSPKKNVYVSFKNAQQQQQQQQIQQQSSKNNINTTKNEDLQDEDDDYQDNFSINLKSKQKNIILNNKLLDSQQQKVNMGNKIDQNYYLNKNILNNGQNKFSFQQNKYSTSNMFFRPRINCNIKQISFNGQK
ncbi:hypothetical protein PPERSA_00996 [Pseudocohnilembus persalinus]|uniref:Uncharacterized protein n=1 Tax=Pseudocohnilembus persalinus TaxID=266149 RepID=A0A0V0R949_PSEPJ|nr:hypothetical protein PPERSA_00996 [Pseudocohnilembus persalinus]|eukprot:KRX10826.1 hypothetical protein PPERSA_00996 [Pseudocohnilembus persalinus]